MCRNNIKYNIKQTQDFHIPFLIFYKRHFLQNRLKKYNQSIETTTLVNELSLRFENVVFIGCNGKNIIACTQGDLMKNIGLLDNLQTKLNTLT